MISDSLALRVAIKTQFSNVIISSGLGSKRQKTLFHKGFLVIPKAGFEFFIQVLELNMLGRYRVAIQSLKF